MLIQQSTTVRKLGTSTWESGAILTNPADGTLLADTGSLPAGDYLFAIVGSGSVAWVYDVQHRNAGNTANNDAQRRRPAAGPEDVLFPNRITLAANERLRLVLSGAITGEVQMSIFYLEVEGQS